MTKEEIIEMAKLSLWGGNVVEGWTFHSYEQLERFAKLVAEKEREECAKLCDVLAVHPEYASSITKLAAQAIRNRGQA